MICAKKNGFTLIELLVYMGIVGVIVVIAGEAFSNSTKFRVRTDNMIKATQEAENAATLFKEDVSQMGAKIALEEIAAVNGSTNFSIAYDSVYMKIGESVTAGEVDSSSFFLTSSNGFSDLTFRKIRYDNTGRYEAVEEVRWFVSGGNLRRACRIIIGDASEDCLIVTAEEAIAGAVVMATNVRRFNVIAPNPLNQMDVQIFPEDTSQKMFRFIPRVGDLHYNTLFKSENQTGDTNRNAFDSILTLSNFVSNYNDVTNALNDDHIEKNEVIAINPEDPISADWTWHDFCREKGLLSLKKDSIYEISFEMPSSYLMLDGGNITTNYFVPGVDHMSVGFRDVETGTIPKVENRPFLDDFMFYPPYNKLGVTKRVMRFTVPAEINDICLAMTFACYSPLASDSKVRLRIKNLKVKMLANYGFDESVVYDPENTILPLPTNKNKKKYIRALRMKMEVSRGAKNGQSGETGNVDVVVPLPSNGPKS